MEKCDWIWIGWLVFTFLVYFAAWLDYWYYAHNVKKTLKRIKDVLTEE